MINFWGIWPQPAEPDNHQAQNEEIPNLIPIQQHLNEGDEQVQENHAEQVGIEEVIQAAEEIEDDILLDEGQVIAMDALMDSDVDDLPPPLIDETNILIILPVLFLLILLFLKAISFVLRTIGCSMKISSVRFRSVGSPLFSIQY